MKLASKSKTDKCLSPSLKESGDILKKEVIYGDRLTRSEAADYLRLSTKELSRKVKKGEIKAVRIGKRKMIFLKSDLDDFINNRRS